MRLSLIIAVIFLSIPLSKARGIHDAFIELDKRQSQIENETFRQVPSGNLGKTDIPKIDRMKSYARALLSGQWLALLYAGDETKFARTIGEGKIPDIMKRLREEGILDEVQRMSEAFDIHPLHILGPIVGENTFNGSIDSTIQDSMLSLLTENDYQKMSKRMDYVTNNEDTKKCLSLPIRNYWKWRCILVNSNALRSGSNRDFAFWFYSRSKKGQGTFGIGQAQPYLLWGFNDIVRKKLEEVGVEVKNYQINDLKTAFRHTQDDQLMVAYIAAMTRQAIDTYKMIGKVDISNNPGLTTTLYNLGDFNRRAFLFKESGRENPSVNYMGWFVNEFSDLIMSYY